MQDQNISSLIGVQTSILNELEERFLSCGIELEGNLLDVGCSYGRGWLHMYYNSNKFDFVAGVDTDKTAIDIAKNTNK